MRHTFYRAGMFAALLFICVLIAGCSRTVEIKEPVTLTIGGIHPAIFYGTYGEQIEVGGRQITVKVVPFEDWPRTADGLIDWQALLLEFEPDIMYAHGAGGSLNDGTYHLLDSLVSSSGHTENGIPPLWLEQVRKAGEGNLYAWPLSFQSNVLFYNKALFDRYRVSYPPEEPSWADVLQLVKELAHMSGEEELYPLLIPGQREPADKLYWLLYYAGKSEALQLIDADTGAVTANTEPWQQLWTLFIDSFRAGLLSNEEFESETYYTLGLSDEERYKLFTDGRAAMVQGDPSLLYTLARDKPFEWGVVRQPGREQIYFQVSEVVMINEKSMYKQEAWELIDYLGSEHITNQRLAYSLQPPGRIGAYQGALPARSDVAEQALEMDLSPFYEQPLAEESIYRDSSLPSDLFVYMKEQTMLQIDMVLNDEKSVDQALEDLQALLEVGAADLLEEGAGQ